MFLHKIDEKILGICTKVSHWVQEWTGKSNYTIARIGVLMTTFETMMEIFNYFHRFLLVETSLLGVLGLSLLNITFFIWASDLDEAEKRFQSSEEKVLPRLALESRLGIRMCVLFVAILFSPMSIYAFKVTHNVLELFVTWYAYGLVICLYFVAVEPLKPRKGKVREWIERLSSARMFKQDPAEN